MPQPDDDVSLVHNRIFSQSLREVVLPELEQFFLRCEMQGVSRKDARACIASKFVLEDVARDSEEARALEARRRA